VLLPDTEAGVAHEVLERLREEIARLAFSHAQGLRVSLGIGIASFDTDLKDAQAWLKHADDALYRAKNQGRNRMVLATAASTAPL
jgi:diguanylate cyclase